MRICLILLILLNSAFLFGKSSEFGTGTIAVDGDSTSVFKPQRELYFSCFSPLPRWRHDFEWQYRAEIVYSKSINKWTNINHGLIFHGYKNGPYPYTSSGEFYEFTFSHTIKLIKKGNLRFKFDYGVFTGDFRTTNNYYVSQIGGITERIVFFGIGPTFKGKLTYNFTNLIGLSISSNYRTFFAWGTTNNPNTYSNGYEFAIYPFWQYLQIGIDIKLNKKK